MNNKELKKTVMGTCFSVAEANRKYEDLEVKAPIENSVDCALYHPFNKLWTVMP